jgi:ABC-type antimicrobial peptide transport system, ATPase component
MTVLKCTELTKTYFQGDEHIVAVKDCFFKAERGEFVSIVGPSGSGKSTLLHMLCGLDRPTSGKVLLGDTDVYSLSDKKAAALRCDRLGMIYQSFNLLPVLTAKENILLPNLIGRHKPSSEYFDRLCALLDISDRIHHLPSELSGGQQQRVAVARALINKPEIIFADEPTGNLDRKSADELVELLLQTRREFNQTLIVVTHDKTIADRADRVLYMNGGVLSA